jgi:phage antirepressor YoqD-like protein/phage anti-repressor protein
MDALIPTSDDRFPVDARELHANLGLTMKFADWILATIERYRLAAGIDFIGFRSTGNQTGRGGDRRSVDYRLSQNAAKIIQAGAKGEIGAAVQSGLVEAHGKLEQIAEVWKNDDALALEVLRRLSARVARAEAQVLQLTPKAETYDAIMSSEDLLSIAAVSNIVSRPGHPMGEIRLFRFLREQRVLQHSNHPYQEHIDAERFVVRETEWTGTDGTVHVKCQTLVTQKGVEFIRRRLDSARGQGSLLPARAASSSHSPSLS